MKKIGVKASSLGDLIAQANTVITLSSWFEESESRTYVINFYDYCKYMSQSNANGYNVQTFTEACKLMTKLDNGEVVRDVETLDDVITYCYSVLEKDVGLMLIKSAVLYNKCGSDWAPFNITIGLPVSLKNFLGEISVAEFNNAKKTKEFIKLDYSISFDDAVKSDSLINNIIGRSDFDLKEILAVSDVGLRNLLTSGVTYLCMSDSKMKGRVNTHE